MKKKLRVFALALAVVLVLASQAFGAGQTASGNLVSDITTAVRYLVHEDTAGRWPNTEIEFWINDAVRNIIARTKCMSSVTWFTLNSGTSEYQIVENYVSVRGVLYQSGSTVFEGLAKGGKYERENVTGDSPKKFYETLSKTGVGVYPLKDSKAVTVTGNTIFVSYIPMQATLSSSDAIPTPASFDRAIIYSTAGHLLLSDRQKVMGDYYIVKYQAEIDRFRADHYDWKQSIWDIYYPKVRGQTAK